LAEPTLQTVWATKREKNTHIPFHEHNYHELVYYCSGSGSTTVGGERIAFHRGSCVLIPPGCRHDEHHTTGAEVICLGFFSAEPLPWLHFTDEALAVHRILRELLSETAEQPWDYRSMLRIKLSELTIHISRAARTNPSTPKSFAYIINYIKENYHERISLSDCAAQLNFSSDYFRHKFKELTGLSPQQFLLQQRLGAARELLIGSTLSCTEIAGRCGFSTPAQFSRLFRQAFGTPPQAFRQTGPKEEGPA